MKVSEVDMQKVETMMIDGFKTKKDFGAVDCIYYLDLFISAATFFQFAEAHSGTLICLKS
jgi:hypothetical protein